MRSLDAAQTALLAEPATRPIYLIELDYDGPARYSTSGDHIVGGQLYAGAEVGLASSEGWSRAQVMLHVSPDRVGTLISGSWRGKPGVVSLLPAVEYPIYLEQSYVEEDYADQGLVTADPITLLDGVIVAVSMGQGPLQIELAHRALVGQISPRTRTAPPWANHTVSEGTVDEWQGELYVHE